MLKLQIEGIMYFPNCGKENPEDARFCMHCGTDLSGYKVEISPKIEVAPTINVSASAIRTEQIDLLGEKISKAFKEAITYKYTQEKWLELSPEERKTINILTEVGEEAERRGKIDFSRYNHQTIKKLEEFLDAVEIVPELRRNALFWHLKGAVLVTLDKYDDALRCFEMALGINPSVIAWHNKGITLRVLGRYDEANCCFDRALEKNPEDDMAWSEKAFIIHLRMQKYADDFLMLSKEEVRSYIEVKESELRKEGIEYADKALEINPRSEMAWVMKSLFEKDTNKKIRCLDKALEINPRSAPALHEKGVVKYMSAFFDSPYLGLIKEGELKEGELLEFKSRLREAIESLDKALEINPHDTQTQKVREMVLKDLNKLQ